MLDQWLEQFLTRFFHPGERKGRALRGIAPGTLFKGVQCVLTFPRGIRRGPRLKVSWQRAPQALL